jgi:hypothetical protein
MGWVDVVVGTRCTPDARTMFATDSMPSLPGDLFVLLFSQTSLKNTMGSGRKLSMIRQIPMNSAQPGSGTFADLA